MEMSSADTWAIKAKARLVGLAGISGSVMVSECGAVMAEDDSGADAQATAYAYLR
jgi:hypothetical protein